MTTHPTQTTYRHATVWLAAKDYLRIYAHHSLYDSFVSRFAAAAAQITVGNGLDANCQLGPLVNEKIYRNSATHVQDAVGRGGRLVVGGRRLRGGDYDRGHFFPPTIIADADHSMKVMTEETFGPVVGIMPFEKLDAAIAQRYGLAAYVFGRDVGTALKTAEALEAGSVWVNNIHRSYHLVPFGGYKESGLGREKSRYGFEEYLELKTIYLSL